MCIPPAVRTATAAAYDLQLFFTLMGKPPHEVTSADVLGFVTAQDTGGGLEHHWSCSLSAIVSSSANASSRNGPLIADRPELAEKPAYTRGGPGGAARLTHLCAAFAVGYVPLLIAPPSPR